MLSSISPLWEAVLSSFHWIFAGQSNNWLGEEKADWYPFWKKCLISRVENSALPLQMFLNLKWFVICSWRKKNFIISAGFCKKIHVLWVTALQTGENEPQNCLSDALMKPPLVSECLTTANEFNLSDRDASTAYEAWTEHFLVSLPNYYKLHTYL